MQGSVVHAALRPEVSCAGGLATWALWACLEAGRPLGEICSLPSDAQQLCGSLQRPELKVVAKQQPEGQPHRRQVGKVFVWRGGRDVDR